MDIVEESAAVLAAADAVMQNASLEECQEFLEQLISDLEARLAGIKSDITMRDRRKSDA